jgi:CHAT domain-containing protein
VIAFRLFTALALMLAVGGCKAANQIEGGGSREGSSSLAKNLLGESCRLEQRRLRQGIPSDRQPFEIYCAEWQRNSGSFVEVSVPGGLPAERRLRREAVERLVKTSAPSLDFGLRMTCRPGVWSMLPNNVEVFVSGCTLKSGNWPYVTMAAAVGDLLVQAEGLPSSLPVMVSALSLVRPPVPRAETARIIQQIKEPQPDFAKPVDVSVLRPILDAAVGPNRSSFSAGDIGVFQDQTEKARLNNGVQSFSVAEASLRQALDIQSRLLSPDDPGVGDTLTTLALEVSNQGRFEEADALFRRAEPIIAKSPDPSDYPRLLGNLALHAANQRQFQKAMTIIRDATARRRAVVAELGGDRGDSGGVGSGPSVFGAGLAAQGDIANGLMVEAAMAMRVNAFNAAENALVEARRILDQVQGLPGWWRPMANGLAADLAARQNRPEEADASYRRAIAQLRSLFGETWPTIAATMDLAKFQSNRKSYDASLVTYRTAFQMIANDTSRRPDITVNQLIPYMTAAVAIAEREPTLKATLFTEMFRVNQLVRDGVAAQTIARASARLATDDPKIAELLRVTDEATRERDSLRLELAAEQAQGDDRRSQAREEELRLKLVAAAKLVEAKEKELNEAFPGYAKFATTQAVEASEVSSKLAPNEAMVVFAFGRDTSFGFLIKSTGVVAAELDVAEEDVGEAVGGLRRAFEGRGGQVAAFNLTASYRLYQRLFGSFGAELDGVRHLIVVPNGPLGSFPPALFVTEPPADGVPDYRNAAWLAKKMATSLSPSVRAFLDLRALKGRSAAARPFIGFGDPAFVGLQPGQTAPTMVLDSQCRIGAPMPPEVLRALEPLPDTADEVRKVATLLGGDANSVILGRAVNDRAIREGQLDQYRVVYFATHGLLPGELLCQAEPGLALTPPDSPPTSVENDGLLSASKIASLRLNADLVVLSACNTGGSGGKFGGGALSGLAESFFHAGARSLLVTHWQVPSASTVSLTTGLFQRTGAKLDGGTAEALRGAQLALIRDAATSHPVFWAAFTLVGEAG